MSQSLNQEFFKNSEIIFKKDDAPDVIAQELRALESTYSAQFEAAGLPPITAEDAVLTIGVSRKEVPKQDAVLQILAV